MSSRRGAHARAGDLVGGKWRRAGVIRKQLDAGHEPALADVSDVRVGSQQTRQARIQALRLRRQRGEDRVGFEQVETGERCGAAEWMSGEGMAVVEGTSLA